jgi:hypothetical protein
MWLLETGKLGISEDYMSNYNNTFSFSSLVVHIDGVLLVVFVGFRSKVNFKEIFRILNSRPQSNVTAKISAKLAQHTLHHCSPQIPSSSRSCPPISQSPRAKSVGTKSSHNLTPISSTSRASRILPPTRYHDIHTSRNRANRRRLTKFRSTSVWRVKLWGIGNAFP